MANGKTVRASVAALVLLSLPALSCGGGDDGTAGFWGWRRRRAGPGTRRCSFVSAGVSSGRVRFAS